MTVAMALYLLLTIALASWIALHALALVRASTGAARLSPRWRLLAWVPPLTAVALARAGRRRLALAWAAAGLAYLALLALALA